MDVPHEDYGVDGRVEVFLKGSTGDFKPAAMFIDVQLKGTDQESSKAWTVWVSWAHIEYWMALPHPVMIVRYHTGTQKLYYRWVHRSLAFEDNISKTCAISFDPTEELTTADFWDAILEEARAFYRIRMAGSRGGQLDVCVDGKRVLPPLVRSQVIAVLNASMTGRDPAVRFVPQPTGTSEITFAPTSVRIDLGGGYAATASHKADTNATELAHTVGSITALLCVAVGRERAAQQLLTVCCGRASAVGNDGLLCAAVDALVHLGAFEVAVDTVMVLIKRNPEAGALGSMSIPFMDPDLPRADIRRWGTSLGLGMRRASTAGSRTMRGSRIYNAAGIYRLAGAFGKAIVCYRRAADIDPGYRDRGYYWSELGGSLFDSGRLESAVGAYLSGVVVDPESPELQFKLGDALLKSGQPSRAVKPLGIA